MITHQASCPMNQCFHCGCGFGHSDRLTFDHHSNLCTFDADRPALYPKTSTSGSGSDKTNQQEEQKSKFTLSEEELLIQMINAYHNLCKQKGVLINDEAALKLGESSKLMFYENNDYLKGISLPTTQIELDTGLQKIVSMSRCDLGHKIRSIDGIGIEPITREAFNKLHSMALTNRVQQLDILLTEEDIRDVTYSLIIQQGHRRIWKPKSVVSDSLFDEIMESIKSMTEIEIMRSHTYALYAKLSIHQFKMRAIKLGLALQGKYFFDSFSIKTFF